MKKVIIINQKYISCDFADLKGKTFFVVDRFKRTILLNIRNRKRAPFGLQVLREAVRTAK